jgi:hypothetical protein
MLRHRERAVTADDYRRLAQEVPGTDVARVELMPRFKPRERRFDVPGVVSVMVLPARAFGKAPNPRPDRPFIERVHAHLSARTPLATELYVIGCEYVPLGVSVVVTIRDGFGREAVLFELREALRRLLWPLPPYGPGGPAGKGWPLARTVRERELEVEVSRVAGVAEVGGINLFERADIAGQGQWRLLTRNTPDGTQSLKLAAWAVARTAVGGGRGCPGWQHWQCCPGRPLGAAQSLCRRQCCRRAGRSRGVLMDANGQRFWLLADDRHWPGRSHVDYRADCRALRLASERSLSTAPADAAAIAAAALERLPRSVDRHGASARWDEAVMAIVVVSHLPAVATLLPLSERPLDFAVGL